MNEKFRIFKPLFRGLPIIILVMVLAVLAAKKYLNYVTPMYESTAKLELADVQDGVTSTSIFKDLDLFANKNKIATEIEVLKSSNLINKTLSELNFSTEIYREGDIRSQELFQNSPIIINGTFTSDKALDKRYALTVVSSKEYRFYYPNTKIGIKGAFGKLLKIKGGTLLISLNEPFIHSKKDLQIIDDYTFEFLSKQKLLDKINGNLDIIPVDKDVAVIRLNMKSNVPEKAAIFVNKLAEMYIKDYIESKYKIANTTVDFLNGEITESGKKLELSENVIQDFRDERNITNITQETETDLRKISQLKIQLTNIKMNLDAIKDLNKYMVSGKGKYQELAPNFEAFNDLLSTEMAKSAKQLQTDKIDLLLTYTPGNEKVKIIDAKLKDIENYQRESIKNTQKNLQVKYDELAYTIAEAEKVFIGLPEKEKDLAILNRKFKLYETNYNFLTEKKIDAEIAKAAKISFHKVITPGEISKSPVSPIRFIIILVAALLGMMGSVLLVYVVHFAKAKVNDLHTIEKNSTIPVAITTPFIKSTENIQDIFLKEAIKMELKGMIQDQSVLVISSNDKPKDHLFHSKNLVDAFKNQGRKVLIIDATGQLENKFDQENYISYSDTKYLTYTKSLFEKEIQEKMKNYDLGILHNQSIAEGKLALLFMSLASQNLIVLDSRKTAEKAIIKLELLKEEFQLPNVWFVLNKAGYSPSIFAELKKLWKKRIQK